MAEEIYMTLEELEEIAKKYGYKLTKIPNYDCSCHIEYPNINHKKSGGWKCVDEFEFVEVSRRGTTHCKRKNK